MANFWLGPGVYSTKEKDIHVGEEMPPDVDKDIINRLVKSGKVGTNAPVFDEDSELDRLSKKVKELTGKLAEAEKTVAGLTEQLTKKGGK